MRPPTGSPDRSGGLLALATAAVWSSVFIGLISPTHGFLLSSTPRVGVNSKEVDFTVSLRLPSSPAGMGVALVFGCHHIDGHRPRFLNRGRWQLASPLT